METPKYYHFDPRPVKKGKKYEVVVQHIEANGVLRVVFDSSLYREIKDSLKKNMVAFYSNLENAEGHQQTEESVRVEEYCVLISEFNNGLTLSTKKIFSDNIHRVKVLSVNKREGTCQVEGVDDFFKKNVPVTSLYHVPPDLMEMDPFLITCRLRGMEPFEGTDVVELILKKKPIRLPWYAVMTVNQVDTKDDLPSVNAYREMEGVKLRLESHILLNLDLLLDLDPSEQGLKKEGLNNSNNVSVNGIKEEEGGNEDWIKRPGFDWLRTVVEKGLIQAWNKCRHNSSSSLPLEVEEEDDSFEYVRKNVCVAKVSNKNELVRAIVIEKLETGLLVIRHIDEGPKSLIHPRDIYPLYSVEKALCCIPPLARSNNYS